MSTPGISILDGKYMVTMDLFPQQSKEFNQIYKFYEYLKEGRFTTTKCKECGSEPFLRGSCAQTAIALMLSG